MCGAHTGPDHDDPVASELCDAYQAFGRADLPSLEAALDEAEREMVWQVALGIGPEALARRLGDDAEAVRRRMGALTAKLSAMAGA